MYKTLNFQVSYGFIGRFVYCLQFPCKNGSEKFNNDPLWYPVGNFEDITANFCSNWASKHPKIQKTIKCTRYCHFLFKPQKFRRIEYPLP